MSEESVGCPLLPFPRPSSVTLPFPIYFPIGQGPGRGTVDPVLSIFGELSRRGRDLCSRVSVGLGFPVDEWRQCTSPRPKPPWWCSLGVTVEIECRWDPLRDVGKDDGEGCGDLMCRLCPQGPTVCRGPTGGTWKTGCLEWGTLVSTSYVRVCECTRFCRTEVSVTVVTQISVGGPGTRDTGSVWTDEYRGDGPWRRE